MFKEKGKVSIVNKILIVMLAIICIFAVAIISLVQLNKKNVETNVKGTHGMIQNYATTAGNTWDISENGDGSVTATLSEDGTLTISGSGQMKNWSYNATTDWHNSEIREKVKKVVINEGVTSIGSVAFWKCSGLAEITIPEGVTSIEYYAFRDCSSLKSIEIPEGVISIGSSAFEYCFSLTEITILEGVTSIGSSAFRYCGNLTEINIPSSVTSIGADAFADCSNLKEIKVDEDNAQYMADNGVLYTKDKKKIIQYPEGKEGTTYTILEEVTSIGYDAFADCSNLKEITIPEGVTSIGGAGFRGCSTLTKITIPEGVTSIGSFAFIGCISLTEIKIPEGITSIGESTFRECSSLTEITIPEGVTSIGVSAFLRCSSLTSINIPEGVTSIGSSAFGGCSSLTEINVDENNTKYMDDNGVLYTKDKTTMIIYPAKKKGTEYIILEGVTSVGNYAFNQCTSLTSINIPEGVTSIGSSAFDGCSSLEEIEIPEGIISIQERTFGGCSGLTSIKIPEGVTSIGKYAFYECSSLTSINIPEGVTSVGYSAFYGCKNLTIICRSVSTAETYAKENKINYKIDDDEPRVNISVNGTTKPVKEVNTTITIEDELTGVNENGLKYLWSTESENITKEQIVNSFKNGETLNIKDVTGTYYLWIYAKDNVGNESIVRSEAFVIDNTAPTAKVSYSTTAKTNRNVKVTITANEEVQAVTGWTLSTDKKVLTKEYSQNTTETITIKDIAGNETIVNITITNLDKTAPEAKIEYIQESNTKVKVRITTNEEIQELSGWTLSTDKKVLTKEYTQNTTETITIKDMAGNTKTVEISVIELVKIFKENTYKVSRNYIINIQPKTTYENFVKNIEINSEHEITENGKEITGKTLIKTGQKFTVGNQTFTLVVIGDTNGDGQANIKDILDINKHRLNKAQLVNEYLRAGDINEDGKVNLRDILQINKYRLGKISQL